MFEQNLGAKRLELEMQWENILKEANEGRFDIEKIVNIMHQLNELDKGNIYE